jgi:hypothetical protein
VTRPRRATAAVLFLVTSACAGGSPPRLELGAVVVERETGPSGAALARVEVGNAGGRDLLLHGVRFDCGCRLVSALPEALAGGERAVMVVRCRQVAAAPASAREIRLSSNDPERAEAVARFTIVGEDRAGVEPRALYFGYVPVDGSTTRELAFDAGTGGRVPTASDPEVQIEERPPRPDGRRMVRVRFTPHAPGPFHGTLALDGRPAIAVSGIGYRRVLVFPAEVTLPSEISSGALPAIAVKSVGAALEIGAVESPPGLAAELQTTTPGRDFRLVLRSHGRVPPGAVIRLHTSDTEEPLVTIPIREIGA